MRTKKNVLIFPSATYPAMQIIDCLKNDPKFHIVAGSSYPNHSEFVCEDSIINIPFMDAANFLESFIALIRARRIEYIIPTDESIAMLLKEKENKIPAAIVCSPYETTKLCRYKKLTYRLLRGEFFCPTTYEVDEIKSIENFPVFIKPDCGQGSKGSRIIRSLEELIKVSCLDDMVICEYLPGEEYTVDCFTNKDGKLIFCNPRIRTRLMNGITARGSSVELTPEFESVMTILNSRIEFRGYWYAQFRRDRFGNLKLLEISTRFAGSFAISKGKGVNLPLLALCDFSGLQTDVVSNSYIVECDKTYIDRYRLYMSYTHLYIDYDDTVTSREGLAVNPYVIAYLYQCKAKKIKITLITRHAATFCEPLSDSLRRLNISEYLFDEIKELSWEDHKYSVINEADGAIFLDNSFKERKEVHDRLNIPVFDISNIDCLFDWRQ